MIDNYDPPLTPPKKWTYALAVAVSTALIAGVAVFVAATLQSSYGWALFVAVPFVSGMLVVACRGPQGECSLGEFTLIGVFSMLMLGSLLLLLGIEGLLCLAMAFPLWFACMFVGILCVYPIHKARWHDRTRRRGFDVIFKLLILLLLPGSLGTDSTAIKPPPIVMVSTIIDIDAPPEVVWPLAAACGQINAVPDFLSRRGVAYPLATMIDGSGVGARRTCLLSTGPMLETVTVWDPQSHLVFKVDSVPDAMKEWSPIGAIHPPHLHGYFTTLQGQFDLVAVRNADGRIHTRLTGTSWYQNQMAPQWYWQLWCDHIVHNVQLRVMTHIKQMAEQSLTRPSRPPPGKIDDRHDFNPT